MDLRPIRAFLTPGHEGWARRVSGFAAETLLPRTEPLSDEAGRTEARELLGVMGQAGLYAPIGEGDLRGACLAREGVAFASPLADAVWALQGLGVTPLLLAGDPSHRERFVDPALRGESMGAFAITEPGAGSDAGALTTRAHREGDGYRLEGGKWFISNAGIADWYVVFASTDPGAGRRGITAFVVPADAPGFRFVAPQVLSAPHPLGEIAFEGCRVPASARVGDEGRGFALALATLDRLRPTVGAAACGMAARGLEVAADHVLEREQFGKPLAEFQLVQERLGRMALALDAARLLVYRAAWEADGGAERITEEAAMAKAFATEAAQEIIDDAVQLLGGRGVLADGVTDRLYRSIRSLRIYEGTTDIQHLLIAGKLLDRRRQAHS